MLKHKILIDILTAPVKHVHRQHAAKNTAHMPAARWLRIAVNSGKEWVAESCSSSPHGMVCEPQ